ncbi:NADH-quinone oxidoreductase subunit J family protein [Calycomorphotria hydatis]|uniref:NADH-quinone oxidoreductase subunit J n=1 Tax=Calycomorphotria hydatis TaxID=2528027 RepID=A0A517T6Q0_9PLAN|nr:NADH-quinone oxidoreductase subunit J [Calycomorphotria hydatis]QDT64048.1 NADH:ubiquinone oxidoreductase subunit J [Calycomorphotria hydatis]
MNLEWIVFGIFALLTGGGALAVLFTQNVVRMAFWLVVTLGGVAGLYFLMGADFVGATQLLIYVGGTVVLLIFGVMLTATGPYVRMGISTGEIFSASLVGIAMFGLLFSTVVMTDWEQLGDAETNATYADGGTTMALGLKLLGIGEVPGGESGVGFLLPFEIVSIHLLVVLIAAAYLARAKSGHRHHSGQDHSS